MAVGHLKDTWPSQKAEIQRLGAVLTPCHKISTFESHRMGNLKINYGVHFSNELLLRLDKTWLSMHNNLNKRFIKQLNS